MARYMNLSERDRDQLFKEIYALINNTKIRGRTYPEGVYDTLEELGIMPEFNEWVDKIEQDPLYDNMPCDYSGYCAGPTCPQYFTVCH